MEPSDSVTTLPALPPGFRAHGRALCSLSTIINEQGRLRCVVCRDVLNGNTISLLPDGVKAAVQQRSRLQALRNAQLLLAIAIRDEENPPEYIPPTKGDTA